MLISVIRDKTPRQSCNVLQHTGMEKRSRALRRTEESFIIRKYQFVASSSSFILFSSFRHYTRKLETGERTCSQVRAVGEHFIVSYKMMYAVFQFCTLSL